MTIEHLQPVPHLTTVLDGPLQIIEKHLLANQSSIESWFRSQWQRTAAPFYASVDLRNAGFKLAPVDTNLFPAGFNNLSPAFTTLAVHALQSAVERICPTANKIILIPENHTRNTFYLESLASLQEIFIKAGYDLRIGSLASEIQSPQSIELESGLTLLLEPLVRKNNKVLLEDFEPCMVLLNNDLSSGKPEMLVGIEQPVFPPLALGWSNRLKSDHFTHYRKVAEEFSTMIDIDPWLIDPLFLKCGEINFMKREGEACLEQNVSTLLTAIQKKYDEYQIDKEPFVVIKADAGTYGMGIMTVTNTEQVQRLNRKQRTRMSASKSGMEVTQVILQEGIYTFETWGDASSVAEPVVYMIDHFVVGGFYRVHTRRGVNENLNAPGMHFEPLAFAEPCVAPEHNMAPDANPNRFYAYGVMARLALLAAAREIAEH
ncbi:MAG: glutamate--cysteine ligase [Gammaproteobacteria bacterium]